MTRRRALGLAGAAVSAAWLAACGSTSSPSAATRSAPPTPTAVPLRLAVPDPQIAVRGELIMPKDTDPAIDTALESHYVAFSSAVPARKLLFLFMPGTGLIPEEYRLITDQAARNGFHAIGLRYPNSDAVQNLCGTETDTACFEKVRLEIIDGTDRTPKVTVNRPNSIESRLLKVLAYLDAKHPNEGWASYVNGATPKWASIVVAGHSQGGGHAALLARDHSVARVAMLSAPVDHIGPNARQVGSSQPAPWLLVSHVTPADRYYAFCHAKDEGTDWELQWKAMAPGLDLGPIVNPDTVASPFANARALLTEAQPVGARSAPNHNGIARDDVTPKTAAGQPLFAPVWQYVCFA